MLVEVEVVVALQELVGELGERHALGTVLAREATLHRILRHHIVDGDELADVADEVKEREVLHPIVVVDELCVVGSIALEIEELGQLLADALLVVTQHRLINQYTLLRLARRIANHTRGSTNQSVRLVSATLEVTKHHHTHQVADVQRVGGGVNTKVSRGHLLLELLFSAGHHILDHAAPSEFFYKIFHLKNIIDNDCFFIIH